MASRSQFKQINHALFWYYHIVLVLNEQMCANVYDMHLIFACHIDVLIVLDECVRASNIICSLSLGISECHLDGKYFNKCRCTIHCNLICVFYHSVDNLLSFHRQHTLHPRPFSHDECLYYIASLLLSFFFYFTWSELFNSICVQKFPFLNHYAFPSFCLKKMATLLLMKNFNLTKKNWIAKKKKNYAHWRLV